MVFLEWPSQELEKKLYTSQQMVKNDGKKKQFFFVFWYGIIKLDFIINGKSCFFFLEEHIFKRKFLHEYMPLLQKLSRQWNPFSDHGLLGFFLFRCILRLFRHKEIFCHAKIKVNRQLRIAWLIINNSHNCVWRDVLCSHSCT